MTNEAVNAKQALLQLYQLLPVLLKHSTPQSVINSAIIIIRYTNTS